MITIVSGLPRSGTSMMMQMLAAGGLPVLTDGQRAADEDNPAGYFEFEKVKQLKTDAGWLEQAEGKAIKVITQLLPELPVGREYRVILMQRDLDEVLRSQHEMLVRRGRPAPAGSHDEMKNIYARHLEQTSVWLKAQPSFRVLQVAYADVIRQPVELARRIVTFLGIPLRLEAMAGAVQSRLYRNKGGQK